MKCTLSIVLALALVALSCAKREAAMEEAVAPAPASAPAQTATAERQQAAGQAQAPRVQADAGRKLIRTVELDLAVRNTDAAAQQVQSLAKSLGGFVSDITAQRSESLMEYQMTLRVPAEQLDAALAGLRKLAARIDHEQLSTEDATDRYVDMAARVRTLQATEAELRELLAESRERARKVADVMEIYHELTEIRGQIEQIQGQLNAVDRLVSLSTIRLRLRSDAIAAPIIRPDEWRPGATAKSSLRTLVRFVQGLIDLAIVVGIVVVPIILPIALLLWFWARLRRRRAPPPDRGANPPA